MADATDATPPPPQPLGIVGVAVQAVDKATRWTDKQINNAVMISLAAVVGFLIYVDRRDRQEMAGQNMRFFESQSEQNRQVIQSNTVAVQSLSVQVGKLEATVNNLHRTVTTMKMESEEMATAPMPKLKPIIPEP